VSFFSAEEAAHADKGLSWNSSKEGRDGPETCLLVFLVLTMLKIVVCALQILCLSYQLAFESHSLGNFCAKLLI